MVSIHSPHPYSLSLFLSHTYSHTHTHSHPHTHSHTPSGELPTTVDRSRAIPALEAAGFAPRGRAVEIDAVFLDTKVACLTVKEGAIVADVRTAEKLVG